MGTVHASLQACTLVGARHEHKGGCAGLKCEYARPDLQGMGLDFRAASGGPADPLTVSTVASIIFDMK